MFSSLMEFAADMPVIIWIAIAAGLVFVGYKAFFKDGGKSGGSPRRRPPTDRR